MLRLTEGDTHTKMAAAAVEVIKNGRRYEESSVREQKPEVRAKNFEEVCLGYNEEEAMAEASRCLNCKNAMCSRDALYQLTFLHSFTS